MAVLGSNHRRHLLSFRACPRDDSRAVEDEQSRPGRLKHWRGELLAKYVLRKERDVRGRWLDDDVRSHCLAEATRYREDRL